MKHILIFMIKAYEKIIAPAVRGILSGGGSCRFEQTCSQYSVKAISKYGALRGGYLSVKRILACQPFSSQNLKYESI